MEDRKELSPVRDGGRMKVPVPIAYRQVGWMKCVACSDFRTRPGKMWLGVNHSTGIDIVTPCIECGGTARVPQYQVVDMTTGKEIDYEDPAALIMDIPSLNGPTCQHR